jgi:ribosomal-protein-alanine N-acetyltransferase
VIPDGVNLTADRIDIRPLGYPDLPAVIAIERRAFTTPWSLPMFVLELSKPSGICLAAIAPGGAGQDSGEAVEGELVGYLICAHYDQAWHLMNIAVDPDRRRRGIARALIDALIARAGVASNYTLEVRVSNHSAIALYEQYAFRSVGRRRRYYSDNGEDALIMWRAFGSPWLQS